MDIRLPSGVLIQGIPEGTSKEDIQAKAISSGMATAEDFVADDVLDTPHERDFISASAEAVTSFLPSAKKYGTEAAEGLSQMVQHPIDTGKMIIQMLSGGLQNMLGDDISDFVNEAGMMIGLGDDSADREIADAVGKHFANKYGSWRQIKDTLAEDPVSILADAAIVMTGGGALAAKAGEVSNISRLAQAGQKIKDVGHAVDPLTVAGRSIAGTAKAGSALAKNVLGVTTGVGKTPFEEAYRAGKTGGEIQKQFMDNLKGKVPLKDALDIAEDNLNILKDNKMAAYKSNAKIWKAEHKPLSFNEIDKSLLKAESAGKYLDIVKDPVVVKVVDDIKGLVEEFRVGGSKYHTPEGFDQLKQAVWSRAGGLERGTVAHATSMNIYHSIKKTIAKQAPSYEKAMKEYSEASEQIKEITKTLSLDGKASPDTSLRKLQSLMNDNVNTSYGHRAQLGDELAAAGKEFKPALAGQSLQSAAPRGIARGSSVPTAAGAGYLAGIPGLAASLTGQSPRIMGTAANTMGRMGRVAQQARDTIPVTNQGIQGLLNYSYQTQQSQGGQ
jgi:hypothetical protein